MARYRESVRCSNDACAQMIAIEFTEATRQLRVTCPSCGQLNQIEIILPSDRGGHADRYGSPADGEKIKIVVVPGK
jgi:phage FluMu protein Com